MRTTIIIHIFSLVVLILMSACATATRESGIAPPEQLKRMDTTDCPAGFRCHPKDRMCVKAY